MSVSPIHVHVQDNTPLHVHVKKPKKSALREVGQSISVDSQQLKLSGNVRHSVRPGPRAKPRSVNEPWIPAPGRTSTKDKLDKAFKWNSGRSQLEINPPVDVNIYGPFNETPLRTSDLSTDEDNRLRAHLSDYEKKIEGLMAEVGTLKNEGKHLSNLITQEKCIKCGKFDQTNLPIQKVPEKPNRHARCFEELTAIDMSDKKLNCLHSKLIKTSRKFAHDSSKQSSMEVDKSEEGAIDWMKNLASRIVNDEDNPTLFHDSSFREFEKLTDHSEVEDTKACNKSQVTFREPLVDDQDSKPGKSRFASVSQTEPDSMSLADWRVSSKINHTQMEFKKMEEELGNREERLEASKAVLEDKQKELNCIAKEYEETEKENYRLRKSMEKYQGDLAASLKEIDNFTSTDDGVLRQLIEVEISGAEAGKQVAALRDIVKRLKYEKRLSSSDVALLNKQKELLLQKLDEFETSNRTVRRLLQNEHKTLADVRRLEEQRDILMKKMADSDSDILKLKSELIQTRNDAEQLATQVNEEKNHAHTLNELNKSVESTRAHLQRELRAKEMENNRLHVQLKNMERDTDAIRLEAEDTTAAAKSERETLAREKEGLKRATRSQRNRAEKAEDALKELENRLQDRERKLEEARSQADAWRERYQRTSDEKVRLDDHVQSLAGRISESESTTRANDLLRRKTEDELRQQIERLISDNAVCRSDVERYKNDTIIAEERARKAGLEVSALRKDIRQHEGTAEDLKNQLRKAKNEAEEALLTAERVERSSRRLRDEGNGEIERVREQMLERMRDLQPLPELLKETEMKLRDAQDKLHVYEQRSVEQTRIIAELTNKGDDHNDEVTTLRQRISALTDENRALEARLQILHVKLDDRDVRVKETVLDTVNKDEKIQQLQLKLEELTHERDSLRRQLEAAVRDSGKAVESEIGKAAAREHMSQARIVDLETQITRLKTDIASLKRAKEDSERRNQSKLQDARDRLEQAESTNRSMRNYVNFLKTSYNNVFGGDVSLTSTPIRSGPHGGSGSPF
ncbi:outer dense fiber protein 2-like isoform X1 [Clavelina lepadiformis]|uniref:outer dense fiber protein 2-like isoform X1 n=1 Tax=Clavelina lepadiformis TaxID=159417 RepID=UPI004042FA81